MASIVARAFRTGNAPASVGNAVRSIQTSAPRAGGHGLPGQPDFLHAEHLLQFRFKRANKWKAGFWLFGGTALAFIIPFAMVDYQQRKGGYYDNN
ncbi:hypothetical protein FVE85_7429 [Porphyridium purpureum]|uniref:Uncharacterized protein n=1 Tax=Porphyridium purpureum TaxID=35688 RepID=A0A5J4ZA10_PORPP|nr:hypothetical protein FVE85_7429 [Porphyridium purpureum]|eukprot:POR1376..scf295_1